ncbi:MAG: P1 family peptidase, partial [Bryobacteraceae bacterium]|nr:P1 family peptidase [Bryobacteraceae bacterium]
MRKAAWLGLLLLLVPCVAPARSRVFFMSFDALGYERLTADPAAEPLTALRGMMRTGAYAEGLMPAYPSTTANGHAALWTGTYAGGNGILYNQTPLMPRSAHAFTERVVGFRSEGLTAEPIWLTAARQGKRVVAHQVTQVFPFTPQTVGSGPMPNLVVANGFQSRSFAPWQLVRPGGEGVRKVECAGAPVCFEWMAGKSTFRAEVVAGGLRVRSGSQMVEVRAQPEEIEAPRNRALARHWSAGLEVEGLPAFVAFRLFSLAADGSDFELLQTPIQEMAIYADSRVNAEVAREMQREVGPAVGNAAGSLWTRTLINERRFLETLELVVRQQIAEVKWLARKRDPDLLITYVSAIDDLDHLWYGLGESYREWRKWGFVAVNRAAEALLGLASREDHVVVASDHGMAPVEWYVGVNKVLQGAGLAGKAVALNTCVLVNTDDWKGGTVKAAEREGVLDQVAAALVAVKADDGQPVVTMVYRSQEDLRFFGHVDPAGADLCFDLRPGYGPTESGDGGVLQKAVRPVGAHGFDPNRADMKAVLLVTGPRAAAGRSLGPQRSASVAALVADLLGIGAPSSAAFASPLAVRARDLGLKPGVFPPGKANAITDVAGVLVGHKTLIEGSTVRTGVTAILPHGGNVFNDKVAGAVFVGNAFGKLAGSTQVNELGQIETPIVLTNTLSVGTAMEAVVGYTVRLPGNEKVRSVNALVGETNDSRINDIRGMHVRREHVVEAIVRASGGAVME